MRILGTVASSSREVPNAPTIGTATNVGTGRAYNNGSATVAFTAPTFDGGLPITSYTATSSPGGFTGTGASSPITVTGLQSNTSYTFTVTATNSRGTGAASAASNSITATTVPQAPTIGTATDAGTGTSVTVAYTAGATGGAAVSTFTATSSPGSLTGTGASPITVSGLTTGTAYTFTVTATNANGTSAASAASNSVTPASPSSYESIATLSGNGVSTITFSSIPQTYKSLQIRAITKSSNFSDVGVRFNGVTTTSYYSHWLTGNGSTASASGGAGNRMLSLISTPDLSHTGHGVAILDVIDYASTTKNKVIRSFNGLDRNGAGQIYLSSGALFNTSAISSITIYETGGRTWTTGTSFALYGVK